MLPLKPFSYIPSNFLSFSNMKDFVLELCLIGVVTSSVSFSIP